MRRALSQRRSGGVISRERRAWGSGNPGTRQAVDGYLPRSAGMRARGQWTRGTRGDPAELPRRLAVGYGGNDERRLPCRGTDIHKHWNKIKNFSKRKTKRGEWAPLRVLVWSSVTVHTRGRNRNTQTRI